MIITFEWLFCLFIILLKEIHHALVRLDFFPQKSLDVFGYHLELRVIIYTAAASRL